MRGRFRAPPCCRADGNELTRTDVLGHTTTWTSDVRGNRLTERNAAGELTTSTLSGDTHLHALGLH